MLNAKTWTASNMLSLFRVFLLLPIYQGLSQNTPAGNAWALFFMLLAIISDFLDGYLARRLGQTSDLGKVLDPLADKICIAGVCLILVSPVRENPLPLWFLILLLARDIGVVAGGFLLYKLKNIVVGSNIWGKSTSTVLALMFLSYLLGVKPNTIWLSWIHYQFLLYLSLSFMLVSTVSYAWRFYCLLMERKKVVRSSYLRTDGSSGSGDGSES